MIPSLVRRRTACRHVLAAIALLAVVLCGPTGRAAAGEVFVPTTSAEVEPPGLQAYAAAAAAPGYAAATAGEPRFDDRALWPTTTGREAYAAQRWPKARVLTWSIAGKRWHDEQGRPASAPPDEETDVVFPDSDVPYAFAFSFPDEQRMQSYRHITIGRNAAFKGGGDGVGRRIAGNVWIKVGGSMYAQGATTFSGERSTFFRCDNIAATYVDGWKRVQQHLMSQYFTFDKAGAGVEFLGHTAVLDEFRIIAGTVVVAPDSRLMPGRHALPVIKSGATLALMDGAVFSKWMNDFGSPDLVCEGTIQAGLPERPIARSARLLVAFKNHTGARFTGSEADQEMKKGKPVIYEPAPSLRLGDGAALRCFSADPAKARLRIAWSGDITAGGTWTGGTRPEAAKDAARFRWFETLPRWIDIHVGKGITVEAVEIDHLRRGGLMLVDPADRARWRSATFGPACEAGGDALFGSAR